MAMGPAAPLKFSMTLEGVKEVTARVDLAEKRMDKAIDVGLYAIAQNIMSLSKQEAPFDLGVLRGSGFVTLPENHTVQLGYGGAAGAYAVVQHERLDFKHKVGKARFLIDPINASRGNALVLMKDIVEHALRGELPDRNMFQKFPSAPQERKGRRRAKARRRRR